METAVVLRQREVQQLQRLVKKLAGLVDRLVMPGKDVESVPKVRRARRAKADEVIP